jgi:hypothetical protein
MGGCVNAAKRKKNESKCYTNVLSSISAAPSLWSHTISHKMPKQQQQQQQQQQQLGPAMRLQFMSSLHYRSCPLQLSVFVTSSSWATAAPRNQQQQQSRRHIWGIQTAREPPCCFALSTWNVWLLCSVSFCEESMRPGLQHHALRCLPSPHRNQ